MKVELETDEAWNLFSHIIGRMIDETQLSDSDRAHVRRWKSEEMRVASQEMQVLAEKINEDIAKVTERKSRNQLRRPDWM